MLDGPGLAPRLAELEDDALMPGDVTVRVTHSSLNYKDALALAGSAPVVRRWPMVPGIDFAGVVERSDDARYAPGDAVVLTGWGVGETHLGGLAERARVSGDWLVPMPSGLDATSAMAIGTAGLTATLAMLALERYGVTPSDGPALVTGAAGGVGSIAIAMLHAAGWRVAAATGRPEEAAYLRELGADELVARDELAAAGKPLRAERWAAGIDVVGGTTLASALASTRYGGAIAACGLAGGMELPATVAPFILRGVALLGIDSVRATRELRLAAWSRLARDLERAKLARTARVVPLDDAPAIARELLAGRVRGRTVVAHGS